MGNDGAVNLMTFDIPLMFWAEQQKAGGGEDRGKDEDPEMSHAERAA